MTQIERPAITEVLGAALADAVRFRHSLGFLLVTIDHLSDVNGAHGADVGEQIVGEVASRIRARLRKKDFFGRFSRHKFAVVLTTCTSDELTIAAERLLSGVRDETIATAAGPIAVTVTIGGLTAPRHARTVPEILSRAKGALHTARVNGDGSFFAYQANATRYAASA